MNETGGNHQSRCIVFRWPNLLNSVIIEARTVRVADVQERGIACQCAKMTLKSVISLRR